MSDRKHILSISGGKDSMATAILAIENNEPLDMAIYCEVMFDKDISGEVPEHHDFVYEKMIPYLEGSGVPVSVVRGGKTYLDCFFRLLTQSKTEEWNGKHYGFPIGGMCVINRDCKTGAIRKFMRENGLTDCITYVGIAADEPKRLARLEGTNKVSLLAKYGYTEDMAAELCKERGLYSPAYEYSKRNGCWFCPNCRMSEFAEFKRRHPDLWQKLLELGKVENKVSIGFSYGRTIEQIDEQISMQAAQMRIEDYE